MIIRELGQKPYLPIWEEMKEFTANRNVETADECWFLEHHPVYTQGIAGKAEHVLNSLNIPIVQSDRGGQITYHGPGQLIVYVMFDLHKLAIGVRTLVTRLEQTLIQLLQEFNIDATNKCNAPGVYVDEKKIASLGLRVKSGRTYHGIALNVNMDLKPFQGINPCGFENLQMTQINDFVPGITVAEVQIPLKKIFVEKFS